MDPLYDEDYDTSGAHSFLTKDCDEESMDIYSGLGDTPTHTTETPSMLFSPRVKESMDLYEEILTEEVRSKDSSFEELKARFLAAQSQIEELRTRLAHTETQNTGLNTENMRLKKNISSLLKTARQEVLRKDQEIKRLNQSSGTKTYNPRANGQWRTFPNNHTNKPPPLQPLPHPGPGNASSPIAPASRTPATPAATPAYPPPPQHRPGRTSSTGSTTSTPPAPQTTPLLPSSRALPQPQPRRTPLTHSSPILTATPPNPPPPQHRPSRSSAATCGPPAPPTETALPSLPHTQQSKTPSSLSTTCKPSPPPTNPPPPKHRPSRTSSTSSISCGPPAPPTESPLPSPSQPGRGKKSSSMSSTSIPSAPPTNPPLPSSLPLPKPIRTSSRISTNKESSPPPPPTVDLPPPPPHTVDPPPPPVDPPPPPVDPPPHTVDPPPPPVDPPPLPVDPPPHTVDPPPPPVDPPPPPVDPPPPPPPTVDPPPVDPPPPTPDLQPRPPSPLSEAVRPESLPPPPPPEKVRDGAALRPDTTCLETSRSRRPTNTLATCSSRLDLKAMDKQQEVESQSLGQSSSELPPELGELDTPKPSKHKEQEPKSQTRSQPTDKRLKSSSEPGKDSDTNHRNRSRRAEKESRTKHKSHRLLKSSHSQEAEEHHRSESAKSPSSGSLDRKQDKAAVSESNQNSAEPKESRLRDSVREHRKDKHADRTREKKPSGSSRDRRNSTTKQHTNGAVESSKRKGDRADPSGEDRRKSERRREGENGKREKRSEKHKDSDRKRWKGEGRRKESREGERSIKDLEKPSEEEEEERNIPTRRQCLKENSPNRKLCFMETLNLTLSPVKKPQTPQGEEEEDGEIVSRDDDNQPNLEEFLIIDEIENSMNEMEIDHDKQYTKPSSAILTSTDEKCAMEKVEKDQILTTRETSVVVVSEQPEVLPVPRPSECDLPEAKESINADGPPLKRPVVAKESIIISTLPAENMQCSSPNHPVEMAELNPRGDEMVSISEDRKHSPSQNNKPDNLSEVIESDEPIFLESQPELQESPSTVDTKKMSSLSPITSPVPEEVKEAVSCLSPITSPVPEEVKEAVSCLSPINSPVVEEVKKAVSCLSPINSPVVEEVKETVSCLSPIKTPVADVVKEMVFCPCPITSPVSEGVHKTMSKPSPIINPVSGEVQKRVSGPRPITRVAGEVKGKVSPGGAQSPPDDHLQPVAPASASDGPCEGEEDHQESSPKGSDTVSSTITLEALPHGDISLPEAIYVLTRADGERSGERLSPSGPRSSASCVGVSKVSSTTEDMTSPGRRGSVEERTPVKGRGFCDRRRQRRATEEEEAGAEPSSSGPLFYDEDSMMLTLKNLRSIPDVISPLRSPMPPAKRALAHRSSAKPPHVKSLQRDFYSTAVANSTKPNPNKETEYPDDPMTLDPRPVTGSTLTRLPGPSDGVSASSSDLEEGEILSDSNEATADTSPPKSAKPTRPASADHNNKPSPTSAPRTAERRSEGRRSSSTGVGGARSPVTVSPSSGKSRFKKVCPTGAQTPFTTMQEVMDSLKKVRFQIRKKYMKLHKVFPKKSFYAMMDHFQQSFMEYVETAVFSEISTQVGELKARLRKLVVSVFMKVMNNGIVNRIFDLQASNLKRRLWEFVEVQLDYLFMDIQLALNAFCKPSATHAAASTERKVASPTNGKIQKRRPVNASPKKSRPVQTTQRRIQPRPVVPCKTGLGRGKDIRIICMERRDAETNPPGAAFPPRSTPLTPEKGHRTPMLVSHNGTIQDRSDFEILTEQQASSLTFNLVRDTQMGEIFKCLMQGSDLLDTSVAAGDATSWSLSTPRKECLPGDSLLSIASPNKFLSPSKFASPGKFVTPTKFATSPSKLVGAWSSPSPSKLCSPQPKRLGTPLNPAMFDESCLLELPAGGGAAAQRSYSLLAEDLAVSLTIPSPLKSDSHLSFLQPCTLDMMSTPESVISAHFGEDALLDGEDAWEQQDLHLALDTDNSSCCSSTSTASAAAGDTSTSTLFQFKPHLPMQAVVMERSNDHFIVKIRQSAVEDVTLTADDSLSRTLTEEDRCQGETRASEPHTAARVPRALFLEKSFGKEPRAQKASPPPPEETIPAVPAGSQAKASVEELASSADDMEISTASEGRLAIVEDASSGSTPGKAATGGACRKRKTPQQKTQAKRAKKEEGGRGRRKRRKASPTAREPRGSKQEKSGGAESPPKTPPSSLSAKNVVKKKGEVVVAWTRDEDRAVLLDLKTKGPSRETFSVLSEKLNKTSAQIAERFSQLMKLFKKQEKRDHSSP